MNSSRKIPDSRFNAHLEVLLDVPQHRDEPFVEVDHISFSVPVGEDFYGCPKKITNISMSIIRTKMKTWSNRYRKNNK